jgi:2-C-methyl-D-erythritol 4-phosphate cytidylyltransferase
LNAAIILAGGKGERLNSETPKQFIKICDKAIVNYVLETFENCAEVDIICVVIADEYRHILRGNYTFAEPGMSRQHSIYNGLLALRKYSPEYVIIHDAARPLVTKNDIINCIKASKRYDGATPMLPVTDTIYHSTNGKTIEKALNRDELFAGQTPECYDFKKYLAIHKNLSDNELLNTRGSSEIAVQNNLQIALCVGNPNNFKITTNADLERFRGIIEKGQQL